MRDVLAMREDVPAEQWSKQASRYGAHQSHAPRSEAARALAETPRFRLRFSVPRGKLDGVELASTLSPIIEE
jgi:hypothetical protein